MKVFQVIIVSSFLFVTLLFFFPVKPYASFDNIPHALVPLSVIKEGNFDLSEFSEADGKIANPEDEVFYYYLAITDDQHVVSAYPIGVELLAVPIYKAYSLVFPSILDATTFDNFHVKAAAYITAVTLTTAAAIAMYFLLKDTLKHHWLTLTGTALFIFGTEVISTSSRFLWQHTGTLLWLSLALLAYRKKRFGYLLLCSVMTAVCRPHSLLVTLPLIVKLAYELFVPKKKKPQFSFTQFLTFEYVFSTLVTLGVIGILLSYSQTYFNNFNTLSPHYSSFRFTGSALPALAGLLFSPSRGLFVFSPFFLCSAWVLIKDWRKYWEYGLGVVAYILLTSCWDMWWGGTSHGYRMLIEVIPTLTLFFGIFIEENLDTLKKSFLLSAGVSLLVGWSVLVQTIWGAQYGDCGFNAEPVDINVMNDEQLFQKFWSLDSEVVYCWRKMNAAHGSL